jgi:FkbM family methyltransferase
MRFLIRYLIKIPILKRLIPSFFKKFIFFFQKYKKEILVNNIYFDLDLRHLIDRRFYFHNTYEDELFIPLYKIINEHKADFFFDVGSCWGIYSLRLSNINEKIKILAFDPIKKNINRLKFSVTKNDIKNIEVFHTAIGNTNGTVELGATEDYSPNYEINEVNAVINEKSKINLLDNLFHFKDKFLVFKIDTEGSEYDVLKGSKKLLTNNKCFLQIEIKKVNFLKTVDLLNDFKFNQVSINKINKTDYFFSNFDTNKISV